ncbi:MULTISPECIES: hypothetical protein [Micrococcaceae]|jgi:hypothetical protein|uniref:Integral membrane protein n=3 Tax=Micrococcaceae TaxID=1268 RepID=Q6SKA7_PAEAU|nr:MULTISPECIES: hypothetical protein [Micrococcaceae]AAS20065.1 integral membrane protein [Paenarthrobacter aurescens]ABM10416.1 putative Membrane protein [Paenarthrobacter aurescens TC1]SDQ03164.1 hypothetical protein SAMN04489742_0033 [Arthrobacter crystallopoietes]
MPASTAGRHLRTAGVLPRTVVVTVVVIALAAGAHTIGGGTLPAAGITATLGAMLLLPVRLLVSRQLPARALLPVMAAGQLLLHELFGLLAPHQGCLPAGFPPPHHGPGPGTWCAAAVETVPAAHLHLGEGFPALPMALAHLLAAAAAALMVTRGETALRFACNCLLALFRLPAPAQRIPAARVLAATVGSIPATGPAYRPDSPRGPPHGPGPAPALRLCQRPAGSGAAARSDPAAQRAPYFIHIPARPA